MLPCQLAEINDFVLFFCNICFISSKIVIISVLVNSNNPVHDLYISQTLKV